MLLFARDLFKEIEFTFLIKALLGGTTQCTSSSVFLFGPTDRSVLNISNGVLLCCHGSSRGSFCLWKILRP